MFQALACHQILLGFMTSLTVEKMFHTVSYLSAKTFCNIMVFRFNSCSFFTLLLSRKNKRWFNETYSHMFSLYLMYCLLAGCEVEFAPQMMTMFALSSSCIKKTIITASTLMSANAYYWFTAPQRLASPDRKSDKYAHKNGLCSFC